ncbi:MAG TPA: metallophosphoesterase [Polyangiaceae bacterium]|nr:metallophosphoesterase [Polyangiaceae bacterium]
MSTFVLASLVALLLVVTAALLLRSRLYATFRGVSLGVHILIAGAIAQRVLPTPLAPLFIWLHACLFVQALALVRPRLRPLWYRALVSIPGSFFGAGTLLALPWAVAIGLGFRPWGLWIPYALALLGVIQSLGSRRDVIHVRVGDRKMVPELSRHATLESSAGLPEGPRPLRIMQLSDTHLGPFMSVARLRRIVSRAVAEKPDLIFLTGDFLTMESQSDPSLLSAALEPLATLEGRVFACFGNHDHEAPETVIAALNSARVQLLRDESACVETVAGLVQVVGLDYVFRGRQEHLRRVCAEHPRAIDALRIMLLHDPGAFRHVPDGEAELVLSGHTHGGQVGFLSVGLPFTLMRILMNAPDHGLWALGQNRLYGHRGTGHYGFPLRLGVPAEESVLHVHFVEPDASQV